MDCAGSKREEESLCTMILEGTMDFFWQVLPTDFYFC